MSAVAYTINQLETQIATYLGRDSIDDLTQNDQDIGMYALNSARRRAEQAHDFLFNETNFYMTLTAAGTPITNVMDEQTLVVTGTISPALTSLVFAGTFGGYPTWNQTVSSVVYNLWYSGTQWNISPGFSIASGNYFSLTTTSINPIGTYTAHGTFTGGPNIGLIATTLNLKRIKYVSLPLLSNEWQPVEFITYDEYVSRVRKELGRQVFQPGLSLANLGVYLLGNPIAYQQGQTLFAAGPYLTLPIGCQLSVVRWMQEYTSTSQTDWMTTYAPEYLYWQGVIETNNFFKRYTTGRVEGQVDTAEVQSFADAALKALIAWDMSSVRGTSTPDSQGTLQPLAPVAPAPPQLAA